MFEEKIFLSFTFVKMGIFYTIYVCLFFLKYKKNESEIREDLLSNIYVMQWHFRKLYYVDILAKISSNDAAA